jgi:hydroxymethylbilane synthase
MSKQIIRIATRKSPLALWQANHVANLIKKQWPSLTIELLPMLTSGDRFTKEALLSVGGKGLFVKELEEALLDKRADLAVHSMKDVPAELPNGLEIFAICKRDNPFDAFVSQHYTQLAQLPPQSVIGTTSLRRQSQLLFWRPDLRIKSLRGNVNTRLDKLEKGEYDAIILAASGLIRLELQHHIGEIIQDDLMLPACGQGALGIECRSMDSQLHQILAHLNDPSTASCVAAERQVNARLGGNCHVPLAVFCQPENHDQLRLRAKVLSADGQTLIFDEQTGPFASTLSLADACADSLLHKGADQLLANS